MRDLVSIIPAYTRTYCINLHLIRLVFHLALIKNQLLAAQLPTTGGRGPIAREPDVALLMAAFVKKYVKICKNMFKNVKNMALSAKKWLSQSKRFPTPALQHNRKRVSTLQRVAASDVI